MPERKYNVAVVGVMGLVGTEILRTLERRRFPIAEFRPLDVESYTSKHIDFQGQPVPVQVAEKANFKDIDIAIFSAGSKASKILASQAVDMGAVVIDNSSQWRMDPECPLVIPEVNLDQLQGHSGIIANPNCSTILLVTALNPLYKQSRITRVIISTYQSAAGMGQSGYDGLRTESEEYLRTLSPVKPRVCPVQLAFNAIPHIDVFQELGYTKEEYKLVNETRKILNNQVICITATCVRIPVFIGHAASVYIETEERIGAEKAREILADSPSLCVRDDPWNDVYPTPFSCENTDETLIGRIRDDLHIPRGINLWIVSNNIRKGAALNTVQIAEKLVQMNLVCVPEEDIIN